MRSSRSPHGRLSARRKAAATAACALLAVLTLLPAPYTSALAAPIPAPAPAPLVLVFETKKQDPPSAAEPAPPSASAPAPAPAPSAGTAQGEPALASAGPFALMDLAAAVNPQSHPLAAPGSSAAPGDRQITVTTTKVAPAAGGGGGGGAEAHTVTTIKVVEALAPQSPPQTPQMKAEEQAAEKHRKLTAMENIIASEPTIMALLGLEAEAQQAVFH